MIVRYAISPVELSDDGDTDSLGQVLVTDDGLAFHSAVLVQSIEVSWEELIRILDNPIVQDELEQRRG